MPGRIEIYIDLVSFYSYIAFKQLLDTRVLLEAHGVEIDIKPVLLGAVNAGSGNTPPWTVAAKAKYLAFDGKRSKKAAGLPEISPWDDLMAVSRTIIPLRALHYIKATYPEQTYLTAWHYLLDAFWATDKRNLTQPEVLAEVVSQIPSQFSGPGTGKGSKLLFERQDVERIMKATAEDQWKDALKSTVEEALKRGAFGAPWLWVTNGAGKSEPFFGSDRWHFVYEFLGLPYQKVALSAPRESSGPEPKL